MNENNERNDESQTSRETSVSSIDSETAFEEWMEARPRPEVTVPDDVILFQSLKTLGADHLRDTLTKICQQIPSAREFAIKELLVYKDELLEEELLLDNSDEDPEDHEADGKGPENFEGGSKEIEWRHLQAAMARICGIDTAWWKQKCPKYETCRRCGEEYEHVYMQMDDCEYHPGNRRVDKNSWIWKKESFDSSPGAWEDLENTSPELSQRMGWNLGFKWDCCNEVVALSWTACKKGRHIPREACTEGTVQDAKAGESKTAEKSQAKDKGTINQEPKRQRPAERPTLAENARSNNREIKKKVDGRKPTTNTEPPGKENEVLKDQKAEKEADQEKRSSRRIAAKRQRESEDGSRKIKPRLDQIQYMCPSIVQS